MPRWKSAEERYWDKVSKTDSCWLWAGSSAGRYGQIYARGKTQYTHRFSWELTNGPIPSGLSVLHRCDVPLCVNPEHLFLGTQQDNMTDKVNKNRQLQNEAHPKVKLSDADIRAIRADYDTGEVTQRELARRYGVTFQHVCRIVHNERRHLP